jgi:hypothetical protein
MARATPQPAPLFGTSATREALGQQAEAYVSRALVMLGRARAVVRDDRVDAIDLLTARRGALGRHFQGYQKFKHGSIFDPVVRDGTASSKVVARTMKVDCVLLGELFCTYHMRWLRLCPAEWSVYRRDMEATAATLEQHLTAELRAMRQLLLISNLYGM